MAKSLVPGLPGAALISLTFRDTLHHLQGPHSVSFPRSGAPASSPFLGVRPQIFLPVLF